MRPSPLVTYPLRRVRGYGQRLARRHALAASLEAAARRAERQETHRVLDEKLPQQRPGRKSRDAASKGQVPE